MEKPILFNTEMVRAILDGRKAVTRRVIKPQPAGNVRHCTGYKTDYWAEEKTTENGTYLSLMKPPYQPGDILYVREKWCLRYDGEKYFYFADKGTEREESRLLDYDDVRWRPSIHMPKEAARIFLKVKSVEAQRLHDLFCCRNEIIKEGIVYDILVDYYETAAKQFRALWDSTVKPEEMAEFGFDANPWVWAIEFVPCDKPDCLDRLTETIEENGFSLNGGSGAGRTRPSF